MSGSRAAILAVSVLLAAAAASAQQSGACFDKIAVSDFSITPDRLAGDTSATFHAVITNSCSTPMTVSWEVRESSGTGGGEPIVMGKTLVQGASSATVNATTGDGVMLFDGSHRSNQIADDGTCSFRFVADPYDDLRDSVKTNNTSQKITRYVAPAMRTIVLSADVARMFRATFGGRTLGRSPCGVPKIIIPNPASPYSIRFHLDCSGATMGGQATVEAFMTFLLKNGYKVAALRRYVPTGGPDICNNSQADEAAGRSGVKFDAPPAVGSNNPYFKAQLWAQGRRTVVACFALDVTGPSDLNDAGARTPYHCDKPESGWSCESGLRP